MAPTGDRAVILPRRVSVALAEFRRALLDEERAEELETQAREIRRRARLRQIRAIEELLGMAPKGGRRA